jgi:hypothetical protein
MKILHCLALYLLLTACASLPQVTYINIGDQQEETLPRYQFLEGSEDIPLYRGLVVFGELPTVYDALTGRVVDANYFRMDATAYDIEKFYALTLPQLGWRKLAKGLYLREQEQLEITLEDTLNGVKVHFVLSPTSE